VQHTACLTSLRYGFDILIDADLKAWLLEINAAPSLTANTEEDYNLKFRLLDDTLTVVDMDRKLTGNEEQVGGFDLIYRTGFVKFDHNCTVTSYLGCHNNRNRQLKRLAKQIKKRKDAEKEKGGGEKAEKPKSEAAAATADTAAAAAAQAAKDRAKSS
jgi:tubulin polyglutamylase TTLL9